MTRRPGWSLALSLSFFTALWTGCVGLTGPHCKLPVGPIPAVNHVVIMFQENRAFDSYFGQMTAYRRQMGIPINSSDGMINDLRTGNFSNAGMPRGATAPTEVISVYHTGSVCTEDLTPEWAETHKEMDVENPAAA